MALEITIHSVENIPDKSGLFNKTDAYVVVKSLDQTHRTKVKKNSGTNPSWGETGTLKKHNELLNVSVFDKHTFGADEELAKGHLTIRNLPGMKWSGSVPISGPKVQGGVCHLTYKVSK